MDIIIVISKKIDNLYKKNIDYVKSYKVNKVLIGYHKLKTII